MTIGVDVLLRLEKVVQATPANKPINVESCILEKITFTTETEIQKSLSVVELIDIKKLTTQFNNSWSLFVAGKYFSK